MGYIAFKYRVAFGVKQMSLHIYVLIQWYDTNHRAYSRLQPNIITKNVNNGAKIIKIENTDFFYIGDLVVTRLSLDIL